MSYHRSTLADLLLISTAILSFTLLLSIPASHAADKDKASTPIYQPEVTGKPTRRVGGGTRGMHPEIPEDEPPILSVLTPEHTGYTTQAQPILYWAVSQLITKPFTFTLVHADPTAPSSSTQPILEVPIANTTAGIQAFDLAAHDVVLQPEIEYQWAVTIITDEQGQPSSRDMISTGTILRVSPSTQLTQQLANAQPQDLAFIYAEHDIWYDALESVSKLIDADPEDKTFQQQRFALLKQVGLGQFIQ